MVIDLLLYIYLCPSLMPADVVFNAIPNHPIIPGFRKSHSHLNHGTSYSFLSDRILRVDGASNR